VPHPIEELASTRPQADPWISIDEHRLYYAERVAGSSSDLFVATR
jgi:hypothetical protein